jgi:hypothetical protein
MMADMDWPTILITIFFVLVAILAALAYGEYRPK